MAAQYFTYAEAAEYLRCSETWLRRHAARFPRRRRGRQVLFSVDDLAVIDEMTQVPATRPQPVPVGDLANLRPLPRRRTA